MADEKTANGEGVTLEEALKAAHSKVQWSGSTTEKRSRVVEFGVYQSVAGTDRFFAVVEPAS